MGVENLGPFLYSFIRFTKLRQIVEIGSGYTSLWILQALQDNDDELSRINELEKEGRCRLLDWPWTVPAYIPNLTPSSLLCIDNCLHQKQTASEAANIAKLFGLYRPYMKFIQGEAFDDIQNLADTDSIDLLWCDFGVGSRIREFVSKTWRTVRPGGFFIVHSSLTNLATRDWLEQVRTSLRNPQREGQQNQDTGFPLNEFVEISFLEPHKHYQNSISILQRRGKDYSEPIYSEYA